MSTSEPAVAATSPRPKLSGAGLIYALAAYVLWGVLPIYFVALAPANAFEIVAWRIVFSLVFCAVLLTVTRGWRPFFAIARQPRLLFIMALAGVLIYINWQTFVLAAVSGHVVEGALGYFINPIVTVLLGVLVLRERLRPAQWVAIAISAIAVIVLAVGYGSVPWIALILALSFGFYGLIKKRVGPSVDSVSGLTLETVWLTPVAVAQILVVSSTVGLTFGTVGTWHTVAMLSAGVVTAVPLLLFASAARRLPLTVMGFVQYLAPIMQLAFGVAIMHEPMPPERWFGFALVWLALGILTLDMVIAGRSSRRASARTA
ncbi:EamA family transporter RarD [Compostimonas suwonensis]|uniref:Chloramphenicol-sensitive protein RarD n=1 Tax=Compostimonas suwonensis TaxID=1048394 RepID=A0A2M9BV68_9MICO|nr:EamA family transporter RarD [Compostimonas suwonensis]PJJ61850.1 chloramphenicol-sensitive protein RarD [Compostimonas suwonensis]